MRLSPFSPEDEIRARASDLACQGTYALTQYCPNPTTVKVGALGLISLDPGYYTYIGSAFGPGGLAARLRHHVADQSPPHWHLDYLRSYLEPASAWVSLSAEHFEHRWARAMSEFDMDISPVARFGCSDCCCASHLFYVRSYSSPSLGRILGRFKGAAPRCIDLYALSDQTRCLKRPGNS